MMKVFLHSFRIHDTKKQHLEIPCPGHKLPQEISKAGMRIKRKFRAECY